MPQTSGDLSDPHLGAISYPAHTSGKTEPHFIVFHVLPWLRRPTRSSGPLSSGSELRSRLIDLHELMCTPIALHLLPPGPRQSVINSPEGTKTPGAGGGAGSRAKHSSKAHSHTDVFGRKLGGTTKQDVRRVTNDEAWAACEGRSADGDAARPVAGLGLRARDPGETGCVSWKQTLGVL